MQAPRTNDSLTAFLHAAAAETEKCEFADGAVSAFAGGSKRHAAIATALISALHVALRGGPCRVFGSDVLLVMADSARYPDVLVTCDERDLHDLSEATVRFPTLLVEVLSETTAGIDRGAKLDEYRTIPTLREYLLVDSRRPWYEAYCRIDDRWLTTLPSVTGPLRIATFDLEIPFGELYPPA